MTTDKIIDAIREIVGEYVNEAKSKYLEARKLEKILEKHLHQEPEKEGREGICKICGREGICKICGKEGMYLETDNMMCDSCWGKPSEQGGGMLQPGEYMRDNEGNITTYEDEQKEKQVAKKIEKLDYILEGERPLNTPLTDANMSRIESKLNEVISRINSH